MDAENARPSPALEKAGITNHASTGDNNPAHHTTPAIQSGTPAQEVLYLCGTRLFMVATLIGIMVFIVSIEANIAVTAFVAIARDLGGFETISWVLSSYQLGFVALIVISAKLSDIFGRKTITAGLLILFTVFSAGCAGAQTMTQLIVIRAFQGLGGGGCYTLGAVLIVDAAPPEKYGKYVANAGIAIAMGTVLGPVIGGAISQNSTWRWIFLLNVPVGVLALFLAIVGMPHGFPYRERLPTHGSLTAVVQTIRTRLDIIGSLLLLGAVLAFTACFQEAGSRFQWQSAYVITLLITFVALFLLLLFWERHVTLNGKLCEPVLPWRFFTNRVVIGIMAEMILVGAPMSVTTFQLPQRFQLVNGLSNLDSGLRLLPFGALFPLGSMTGATVSSKFKIPAISLLVAGSMFQVVGYTLLSMLDSSVHIQASIYGYLTLCGFGCGLTFTMAYITVPFTVAECDKAVGMAAANQFRTMGSAVGLAIATSVFNGYTFSRLAGLGINSSLEDIITGQELLPVALRNEARHILSEGYNRQMLVLCAFSAAQIPTALLLWKRKHIVTVA
ncbi:hypothetical protein KVR01_007895 [Diaporthe batatas]|uniref:uncharacterized protein n=1 Tax=Diaporthe batatas TaxID=748121 RepID=UPI001D048136|nr:uncharacterized protein KVR01_007895 [Diaporthe batatas]KAG8162130.1 hypothetical protein KVR01_007895 [Diaporthe batatas]